MDDAISTEMRHLLHNPDFQALEPIWRSLHQMVTGLETGEELKLYLLDVTKQELVADIIDAENASKKSAVYQLLVEQGVETPGGEPWSAIVGDFSFGVSEEDKRVLESLGSIASQAGGPFLASASSEMLGCRSISETPRQEEWQPLDKEAGERWQAFRTSSYASWIGLVLPRVLLSLPYGPNTDEIESFEFVEIPVTTTACHEDYLWGSPAYDCAMLLALAYQENGASMQPGDILDLEDLPAYVFDNGDEKQLMPCAETWLSETTGDAIDAILNRGIMPFLSYRDRSSARLLQFRSLAFPLTSLNGFWS